MSYRLLFELQEGCRSLWNDNMIDPVDHAICADDIGEDHGSTAEYHDPSLLRDLNGYTKARLGKIQFFDRVAREVAIEDMVMECPEQAAPDGRL